MTTEPMGGNEVAGEQVANTAQEDQEDDTSPWSTVIKYAILAFVLQFIIFGHGSKKATTTKSSSGEIVQITCRQCITSLCRSCF